MTVRKTRYSEQEAACKLGVSVEDLRAMVRHHILPDDDDVRALPVLQASDVVVLQLLARSAVSA